MEITGEMLQEQLKAALEEEDLPNIYFNGFVFTIAAGDVMFLLKRQDKPVAILHASHAVAKSFAEKIGKAIVSFESETSNFILTTDEVSRRLQKKDGNK